jgi:phage gp29-like protein
MKPFRIRNPFGKDFEFGTVRDQETKGKRQSLTQKIDEQPDTRIRLTIKQWRDALYLAERPEMPERKELNKTYRELLLDTQIHTVIRTRKYNVLSKDWKIVDANGKMMDRETQMFRNKWAIDLVEEIMERIFWGYNMIEFGEIEGMDTGFKEIIRVPRDHVVPEFKAYRKRQSDTPEEAISIDQKSLRNWVFMAGSGTDLGLLNILAPVGIWKRATMGGWADYNAAFGLPFVYAKTDTRNERQKDNVEGMLKNFHRIRYGVIDQDDALHVERPSVGNETTFKNDAEYKDRQIAKAVLGQELTTEQGSNRAQAEVHDRVRKDIELADKRLVRSTIQKEVIPRMKKLGLLPMNVDLFFEFDEQEQIKLQERAEFDKMFIQSSDYFVDPQYIRDTYGTEVEESQNAGAGPQQAFSKLTTVKAQDYPHDAVEKAREALAIAEKKGGASRIAKTIARKLRDEEPLDSLSLRRALEFAELRSDEDPNESDRALNYQLVGGDPLVQNYAPKKLQDITREKEARSSLRQEIESLYYGEGGEGA